MDDRELIDEEEQESLDWILDLYLATYTTLYTYLSNVLDYKNNPSFTVTALSEIERTVDSMLGELNRDIEQSIPDEIKNQVELGYGENYLAYLSANGYEGNIVDMFKEFGSGIEIGNTADKLAVDTMKDLLAATSNTANSVKLLLQETFRNHMAVEVAKNSSYAEVTKELLKHITGNGLSIKIKNGMIAIVDKAGRRWKLDTYIEMVVKTKYREARVQGMKDFYKKTGYGDLAVIPTNGALDDCRTFEGMIISLTGETVGYRSYDDLWVTGHIFHPRCRHTPKPIFSIDTLLEEDISLHKEAQDLVNELLS